jgi:hypothetical protein
MYESKKMRNLIESVKKVMSGEEITEARMPPYFKGGPMRWRKATLRTKGDSGYAKITDAEKPTDVDVVKAEFMYVNNNHDGWNHYVRVYIDPKTWNSGRMGMLFSDTGFERAFKKELGNQGYPTGPGIQYAESDLQGKDYVTFEIVGKRVEQEWEKKLRVPAWTEGEFPD